MDCSASTSETISTVFRWCSDKSNFKKNYIVKLIKRSLKLHKKCYVNAYKTLTNEKYFFIKYKPVRVCLWLVHKITKNICLSRLFTQLIQTQKKYLTSLENISILTWRLLILLHRNFSCELNFSRSYSLRNISLVSLRF